MKTISSAFLAFVFMILCSFGVLAEEPAPITKPSNQLLEKGGFLELGGLIGYDLKAFDALTPGGTANLGYQINPKISLSLRTDFFAILDSGQTFTTFAFIPTLKAYLFEGLFLFAGPGYAVTHVPANSDFIGTTPLLSQNYQSFTLDGGLGYLLKIKNNLGLFAEAGMNYIYYSKNDLPQADSVKVYSRLGVRFNF